MKHFTLLIVFTVTTFAARAGISSDSIIVKNSSGLNQTKYQYEFDERGNKTNELAYRWDNEFKSWQVFAKFVRVYNNNDKIVGETNFAWNQNAKRWDVSTYDVYSYDQRGNKTLGIQYVWGNSINAWVENFKYEIAYDASNNQTSLTHFTWDAENEWVASANSTFNTNAESPIYNFAIYNKVSCLCE